MRQSLFEPHSRLKAKSPSFGAIQSETLYLTRSRGLVLHVDAEALGDDVGDILDRDSFPRSHVENGAGILVVQEQIIGSDQIADMHVFSTLAPITRNLDRFPGKSAVDEGGDHCSAGVGLLTGPVNVTRAKYGDVHAVGTVIRIAQTVGCGLAGGVRALRSELALLGQQGFGVAIYFAAARVNQLRAREAHRFEDVECPYDVYGQNVKGMCYRFVNAYARGQVDYDVLVARRL
jgi:hypothetical protein